MNNISEKTTINSFKSISCEALEFFILTLDSVVNGELNYLPVSHIPTRDKDSSNYINRTLLIELLKEKLIHRLPNSNEKHSFISVKKSIIKSAKESGLLRTKKA